MTIKDVVIIGAGLAGAAAACTCAGAGLKSIILEARDRVGGRAYTRPFGSGGDLLEFGGSWITPWQNRIRYYAGLTGVSWRPRHPVIEHRFHDGRTLRTGEPCAAEERAEFGRAMARLRADVKRYQQNQACDVAEVSLDAYLAAIDASPPARTQIMAWWTISGNGDPDRISAAEFLSSCAYGGRTPEGMMGALAHTLEPGASILCERMIALSDADLRPNAPVVRVRHESDRIVATTSSGTEIAARSAIVALPLNAIGTITFTPALRGRKAEAAALGHGGRSIKIWIEARGVPVGVLATGGAGGIRWMFAEREGGNGTTLIVGFGLPDFDPAKRDDIASSLSRFFPEAEIIAWGYHDWVSDPWARGTWVALPADALWIADSSVWKPEGRLAFASSDYSPQSPGWFEAAIVAGESAARATVEQEALLS
ncbi:MAG: flavin monoamine oxidase family protein [Hyphomicrobiales bacterium]